MKVLLMTIRVIAGLAITGFGLSSCHSNDNNVVTTPERGTVVSSFYTQSNDQPTKAIGNVGSLQNDINALFGSADNEPVDVLDGESIADVVNRAAN